MSMKFAPIVVLCASLSGCGLIHIPLRANPTRSIHGVRVLDAVTEEDIAEARVSMTIRKTNGDWNALCTLAKWLDQDEANEAIGNGSFSRQPGGEFTVPQRWEWGYREFLGFTSTFHYPQSDPYACIVAAAPGYHAIEYRIMDRTQSPLPATVSTGPDAAATGHRSSDAPPPNRNYIEVARCRVDEDGVLRFYLRKIGEEIGSTPLFFTDQDRQCYMALSTRVLEPASTESVTEQPSSGE